MSIHGSKAFRALCTKPNVDRRAGRDYGGDGQEPGW